MASSFYTVSLLLTNGRRETSRFFNTVRAARNWARFCLTLGEISEVSIYHGPAGSELIERKWR